VRMVSMTSAAAFNMTRWVSLDSHPKAAAVAAAVCCFRV
jgi:hypothetical protein